MPTCTAQQLLPTGPGWSLSVAGFRSSLYWDFAGKSQAQGFRLESPGDALKTRALWASGGQAPAWTRWCDGLGGTSPDQGGLPPPSQIFPKTEELELVQ